MISNKDEMGVLISIADHPLKNKGFKAIRSSPGAFGRLSKYFFSTPLEKAWSLSYTPSHGLYSTEANRVLFAHHH